MDQEKLRLMRLAIGNQNSVGGLDLNYSGLDNGFGGIQSGGFGAGNAGGFDVSNAASAIKSGGSKMSPGMKSNLKNALPAAAGMVGNVIGGLIKKDAPSVDTVMDPNSLEATDIDNMTPDTVDQKYLEEEARIDNNHKKTGKALTAAAGMAAMIPGPGWIIGGGLALAGGLAGAGAFKSKKKSEARKEDSQKRLNAGLIDANVKQSTADMYNAIGNKNLYADGGYPKEFSDLFDSSSNMSQPYEVEVGGTHQQNPNDGVVISHTEGTPNLAEQGEFIANLGNGQFVFTDRF